MRLAHALTVLSIIVASATQVTAQTVGRTPYLPGSVVARSERVLVYREPGTREPRRGTVAGGYRMPAYRFAEDTGCRSWWVEVYAEGWICGDELTPSALPPDAPVLPVLPESQLTPFPVAFAREGGAPVFARLSDALVEYSERWLEQGYAIAVRRKVSFEGERFYGTAGGSYVRMSDVYLARPSTFRGESLDGPDDLGWTWRQTTRVYDELPATARARFTSLGPQVLVRPTAAIESNGSSYYQLADGGYIRATDVRRPDYLEPPTDVGAFDVWFDVDRSQQVLVAYRGVQPIFATLISSGRRGHETPAGVYRVWVKLITDRMANEEPQDPEEKPYYLEDVPWVMYFDDDIALHGAYWHKGFGQVRSHGCVNLAPLDARWVFEHAQPLLPRGWWSILPTDEDPGSVVRVR